MTTENSPAEACTVGSCQRHGRCMYRNHPRCPNASIGDALPDAAMIEAGAERLHALGVVGSDAYRKQLTRAVLEAARVKTDTPIGDDLESDIAWLRKRTCDDVVQQRYNRIATALASLQADYALKDEALRAIRRRMDGHHAEMREDVRAVVNAALNPPAKQVEKA